MLISLQDKPPCGAFSETGLKILNSEQRDLKSWAPFGGIVNSAQQIPLSCFYRIYLPTHRTNKSTYIGLANSSLAE